MIHATFPEAVLTAAEPPPAGDGEDARTVTGVAVPYGVFGVTSAGPVGFARGALPVGDVDVPLLLDHDPQRPIGVVSRLDDDETRATFTATLDRVQAAEDARVQMRSRSRRGVSVGVDVVEAEDTPDGLLITAGTLRELSSVAMPAYPDALVAAARTKPKPEPEPEPEPTQQEEPVPETTPDAPATVPDNVTIAPTRVRAAATLPEFLAGLTRDVRASSSIDGSGVSRLLMARDAEVQAALADITTAEFPPAGTWISEIDNYVKIGMRFVEAFSVRPTSSWPVKQRQVKTLPVPADQTAEKAAIASTPVEVEWVDIADKTKAHGNDVSVQAIEDNGEQVLADLFEIVGEELGNMINSDAILAASGAAQTGSTTADMAGIAGAVGQVAASGRGGPIVAVVAGDVFGALWGDTAGGGPAITRLAGVDEQVRIVVDPELHAGRAVVGTPSAFRTYLSPMPRLRAVDVSLLGVNVGLYRRYAFRVVDANALVKLGTWA